MSQLREQAPVVARDPRAVAALQRRTLRVIICSQVIAGMGLSAGISVGAGIGLAILPVLAWARRARAGGATAVAQRA